MSYFLDFPILPFIIMSIKKQTLPRKILPLFTLYSLLLTLCGCITPQPDVIKLEKANALPLHIEPEFVFRKETQFLNDPATFRKTSSEAIGFLRRSYMWPATTRLEH